MRFYESKGIDGIDLLLPDSAYETPPLGRDANPDLYSDWLMKCFDVWFHKYPKIKFRTFDDIISRLAGINVGSDAFGGDKLDYITIGSDGSFHASD